MGFSSLPELFESFHPIKALIIGDVMVDRYVYGRVRRISPEAPIPIVQVTHRENRPGGAANVALNIRALGAQPILFSVVGDDADAVILQQELDAKGIAGDGLILSPKRMTTVKQRVISGSHQMLRMDEEMDTSISAEDSNRLKGNILQRLPEVDVVILQDYDKGCLTRELISDIIHEAERLNIPTIADPKKRHFLDYKGVSMLKPNLKELSEGLGWDNETANLHESGSDLLKQLACKSLMVTLSDKGVFFTDSKLTLTVPAKLRRIADVSGAGDTVLAIAALCVASGVSTDVMVHLANLAGGIVCESPGVVPVDLIQLEKEAKEDEYLKGIFDK